MNGYQTRTRATGSLSRIVGLAACCGVLILPVYALAEDGKLTWSIAPATRFETNIGLAPDSDSKRDDVTLRLAGSVAWQIADGARYTGSLSLTPFYDAVEGLSDLSNYGATVKYDQIYSLGGDGDPLAPSIDFFADFTVLEYEDSELRDGYKGTVQVALSGHFGPNLGASIGYRYEWRESTEDNPEGKLEDADSDEVFDQQRDGPFIRGEWNPNPKTTVFAEYSYIQGDAAATANVTKFEDGFLFERARDFAFEEGALFQVWKVDADQELATIGFTYPFSEKIGFEFSANYLLASAEGGNDYENFIVVGTLSISL